MIPLKQWLQKGEQCDTGGVATADAGPLLRHDHISSGIILSVPTSDEDLERISELEGRVATVQRQLEEERKSAEQRELKLTHDLGTELASLLISRLSEELVSLQESIETAVISVLSPFLNRQAGIRAAGELVSMIRQTLENNSEPVIEIRLPKQLHELLHDSLGNVPLKVVSSDSTTVELIFSSSRHQLEEMSHQWICAVEGLAR